MNIYKTVFDTEEQGKQVLIDKDVWHTLDFGSNEVYPGDASAHQFYGFPRNAEVPKI